MPRRPNKLQPPLHVFDSSVWIGLCNHPILLRSICSYATRGRIVVGVPQHVEGEVLGPAAKESFERRRSGWLSRVGELELFLEFLSRAAAPPQASPASSAPIDCRAALAELRRRIGQCQSDPDAAHIASVFASGHVVRIESPSAIYKQVVKLGLQGGKPFGKKNSTADAVILLSIVRWVRKRNGRRVVFHTMNHTDFSDPDHRDRPHPDLAEFFEPNTSIAYSEGYAKLRGIVEDLDGEDLSGPPVWGRCLVCGEQTEIESISCVACGSLPSQWPEDEPFKLTPRGGGYLVDSWDERGEEWRVECDRCHKKTFHIELESVCSYHQHMADSD
jgi:hypothetical protein